MKILVTGTNGQLGSELKELAPDFPGLNMVFTYRDSFDITNPDSVMEYFCACQPDLVINCAAYTAVDKAEEDCETAALINRDAVHNLAYACRELNARLIHISTDYVFDGKNFRPYIEEDCVNPISVYGETKMEGEGEILISGVKAIVIRTSWLYSSFGSNFVKTMLRLGKERDSIDVVNDQIGSPTYARDLAGVLLSIANMTRQNESRFVPGVYHYSNEGVASWFDFCQAIFEIHKGINCKINPVPSDFFPSVANRPYYSVLNKSKIKSTFGIPVPYWRESLKICIDKIITV